MGILHLLTVVIDTAIFSLYSNFLVKLLMIMRAKASVHLSHLMNL